MSCKELGTDYNMVSAFFYKLFFPMVFTLPELPYAYKDLFPTIDETTMTIHHGKHHQWYIDKLNTAVEETDYVEWSLDDLMLKIEEIDEDRQDAIRNNGWGHYNHSLFRRTMSPTWNEISSTFEKIISDRFGSLDSMKELFWEAAKGQFGSGRAWLTVDSDWQINIENTANQDNPLMEWRTPLLWLDVREHAYYLRYQNKRADYVIKRRDIVNREEVEKNYNEAL